MTPSRAVRRPRANGVSARRPLPDHLKALNAPSPFDDSSSPASAACRRAIRLTAKFPLALRPMGAILSWPCVRTGTTSRLLFSKLKAARCAAQHQCRRPADRQGRRRCGQGRGAVERLADPALPVAAVPADPRHQLLRDAPDAEECRRRRDGLRQEPRAHADREAGPRDLRRRRRHRRGPRGAAGNRRIS